MYYSEPPFNKHCYVNHYGINDFAFNPQSLASLHNALIIFATMKKPVITPATSATITNMFPAFNQNRTNEHWALRGAVTGSGREPGNRVRGAEMAGEWFISMTMLLLPMMSIAVRPVPAGTIEFVDCDACILIFNSARKLACCITLL